MQRAEGPRSSALSISASPDQRPTAVAGLVTSCQKGKEQSMSTYYFVPSRNVFGEGSVEETGHLIKSIGGTKAMIVTDAFLAANPMTARIQKILADAGVQSAVFGKAEPNPKDTNVVEGEQFYHENECDCILSLGGGSSHDCAKGIGLVATNGGKISDYEGVDQAHEALPPLVAVNTTAGTASEITRFCIITDTARKVKMCIVDWRVTPAIAINDPELMVGMPASLTAATGMDALTHAVEAYVSTAANPLTDAAAIKAIDKIVHYLPQAVANGDYMKARSEMAYAQYLAGVAFNNASLGYVHAMAHQLGGFYNLPHGVCNAILLPYVQEFNLIGNLERFAVIAETMDINVKGMSPFEAGEACVYALKTFGKYLGIPQNLRSLGVKPEDFEIMAEHAMQDACAATNPRKATKEQIIAIFQKAYDGD